MNAVSKEDTIGRGIPVVLLTLAIAGCDGNNYRTAAAAAPPETNDPATPPPVAALDCDAIRSDVGSPVLAFDALPGGIWDGTITNVTKNQSSYVEAWVAEHGRARFLYYPSAAAISADLETSGARFTSLGLAYADLNDVWSDASHVSQFAATGTISERSSIVGNWSAASGDSGCFAMTRYYDYLYEEASALEFIAGVWFGSPTLTVDQNGSFFGQDGQGCTWEGQFALIDSRFNMYEAIADVSDCNIAGSYNGFAYRDYVFSPERVLRLAVDNEHRAIRLHLAD